MGTDDKFAKNWVRLVPNWTNLGIFQIRFSTFCLTESKCTESDLKNSRIICPIWAHIWHHWKATPPPWYRRSPNYGPLSTETSYLNNLKFHINSTVHRIQISETSTKFLCQDDTNSVNLCNVIDDYYVVDVSHLHQLASYDHVNVRFCFLTANTWPQNYIFQNWSGQRLVPFLQPHLVTVSDTRPTSGEYNMVCVVPKNITDMVR